MEELHAFLASARSDTCAAFAARCGSLFLVKRPLGRTVTPSAPPTIAFETRLTRLDVDPYATEWRIAPVRKREDNPYLDRFSIGRAPNCDVVIRLPSVSKLHAFILVTGAKTYGLRDNGASNSTYINGRKLDVRASVPLQVGDEIALGSIELEFADAERLYQVLRTEV